MADGDSTPREFFSQRDQRLSKGAALRRRQQTRQSHCRVAIEILMRQMLKGTDFDNTGVVNQDVDLDKAIDDSPNSRLNLSGVEQIAFNCEDPATAWRKISLCTRQFLMIPRNESNVAAVRANMSREHKSES